MSADRQTMLVHAVPLLVLAGLYGLVSILLGVSLLRERQAPPAWASGSGSSSPWWPRSRRCSPASRSRAATSSRTSPRGSSSCAPSRSPCRACIVLVRGHDRALLVTARPPRARGRGDRHASAGARRTRSRGSRPRSRGRRPPRTRRGRSSTRSRRCLEPDALMLAQVDEEQRTAVGLVGARGRRGVVAERPARRWTGTAARSSRSSATARRSRSTTRHVDERQPRARRRRRREERGLRAAALRGRRRRRPRRRDADEAAELHGRRARCRPGTGERGRPRARPRAFERGAAGRRSRASASSPRSGGAFAPSSTSTPSFASPSRRRRRRSGWYALLHPARRDRRADAGPRRVERARSRVGGRRGAAGCPALNLASRDRRTVAVGDVATTPEIEDPALGDGQTLLDLGTRSVLATPIVVFDRVIGVFSLHRAEPGRWLPGEIALAEAVARELGLAIHTARLLGENEQRLRRQETLIEAAQVLTSDLRFESVIRRLVEEVVALTGADAADCWIIEPAPDAPALPGRRRRSGVEHRPADPAEGTIGRALQTGKTVLTHDFAGTRGAAAEPALCGLQRRCRHPDHLARRGPRRPRRLLARARPLRRGRHRGGRGVRPLRLAGAAQRRELRGARAPDPGAARLLPDRARCSARRCRGRRRWTPSPRRRARRWAGTPRSCSSCRTAPRPWPAAHELPEPIRTALAAGGGAAGPLAGFAGGGAHPRLDRSWPSDERFDAALRGSARRRGVRLAPLRAGRGRPRPELRGRRPLPRRTGVRRRGRAPHPAPERRRPRCARAQRAVRGRAARPHLLAAARAESAPCSPRASTRRSCSREVAREAPGLLAADAAVIRLLERRRARRPGGGGPRDRAPGRNLAPDSTAGNLRRRRPGSRAGARSGTPRSSRGSRAATSCSSRERRSPASRCRWPPTAEGSTASSPSTRRVPRAWRDDEVAVALGPGGRLVRLRRERRALSARRRGEGAERRDPRQHRRRHRRRRPRRPDRPLERDGRADHRRPRLGGARAVVSRGAAARARRRGSRRRPASATWRSSAAATRSGSRSARR